MPITAAQRLVNDEFLNNISNISKNWIWIDKGITIPIQEIGFNACKFKPTTKADYDLIVAIVSPKFAKKRVICP